VRLLLERGAAIEQENAKVGCDLNRRCQRERQLAQVKARQTICENKKIARWQKREQEEEEEGEEGLRAVYFIVTAAKGAAQSFGTRLNSLAEPFFLLSPLNSV